jgi:hypothetical protein
VFVGGVWAVVSALIGEPDEVHPIAPTSPEVVSRVALAGNGHVACVQVAGTDQTSRAATNRIRAPANRGDENGVPAGLCTTCVTALAS